MTHHHFPPFRIFYIFIFSFIVSSPAVRSSDADLMFELKRNLVFITDNFWTNNDPCQWESVQCNNGNVISIKLDRIGLRGTIPQSINQLKSLQVFDMCHNHMDGPLPSFSGMSSLKTLSLHNNRFRKIPEDFFKGLTSLETVSLDKNPFEQWTIPASLADAVALKSFSAISAHIVGKIPSFFGSAKLNILRLSFNYLEGEIPAEFSGSSIRSLWLDRQMSQSKLTGPIDVLSNMTSLVDVWLHYNNFEGVIPNVSLLTKLEDFCVRNNKLFGPVPESLTNLPSLKILCLSNNLFQGKMPRFRDKMEVDNEGNKYCSNSPDKECDSNAKILWKIAEQLKLPATIIKNWDGNDVCNWNGIACDPTKRNVTVISFQNMNLSGKIPLEFANLTSLERVYLQNNNLTGDFPSKFGSLNRLQFMDVSNNHIMYSVLPAALGRAVVQGLIKKASKSWLKPFKGLKKLFKKPKNKKPFTKKGKGKTKKTKKGRKKSKDKKKKKKKDFDGDDDDDDMNC